MEKERVNYIKCKDSGQFTGYPVNIKGVVDSSETLEGLSKNLKSICKTALDYLSKIIAQEEPFDFVEIEDMDEWLYQENAELKKKLKKYEEIFGEL